MHVLFMRICYSLLCAFLGVFCVAQAAASNRVQVDPPNWFTGMADSSLHLLVRAPGVGSLTPICREKGIRVAACVRTASPDYLLLKTFVDASATPGTYHFYTVAEGKTQDLFAFSLLPHPKQAPAGLSQADVIYLLMPDRFSNGDASNDSVRGMQQTGVFRDSLFERHGGDLQGVLNHLDHLSQLGVTALWMNPFQENNQPRESYHGYAITNHYRVDPRLGRQEELTALSSALHKRSMKLVMDLVPNHCGNRHYLFRDQPFPSWFHGWEEFTRTNYRAALIHDTHAAQADRQVFGEGWFDRHMPDFNQQDSLLSRYLIQSYLWWIATAGIDALRIDTYAYSDQNFMQQLLLSVQKEFRGIGVFGEVWDHTVAIQSGFQRDAAARKGAAVPGITDFMLHYSIASALMREQDWTEGVAKLYYTLSQDYLYAAPEKNVVFLDNHDVSRFFSVVGEDVSRMAMGLTFLLTTRGIPCLYYGTEILMKNFSNPDGKVRGDFPGGWKGDAVQAFDSTRLNADQKMIFSLIQKLCRYRKSSPALQEGSYKHFVPEKGVYVYAREHSKQSLLVMMNTGKKPAEVNLQRFREVCSEEGQLKNILSGEVVSYARGSSSCLLPAGQVQVFEVMKKH